MSVLIQQLAAAWKCCAALDALGVRVYAVRCSPLLEEPRIAIDDPGHLLDHVDAQSIDTSTVRHLERAVRIDGCYVYWTWALPPPADAPVEREPWPLPERTQ